MKDFVITEAGETLPFGEDGYTSDGGPFVLVQLFEDGDPAAIEFKARDVLAQLHAEPDRDVFWHVPGAFVSGFHGGERDWSDVRPVLGNLPRPLALGGNPSTFAFLRHVHAGERGALELRAFDAGARKPPVGRTFIELPLTTASEARVKDFALRFGLRNDLYHAIASRRDASAGDLKNCAELRSLYAEFDLKRGVPIAELWTKINGFALQPSAIIHSGGGLHVYWLLAEPIDLQSALGIARAYQWLGDIVHRLGGEPESAEPARVLRIPDTANQKYPHTPSVTLLSFRADRRYTLADVIKVLGDADLNGAPMPIDGERPAVDHHVEREARIRRAQAFLQRQAPAIAGQGGDQRTFSICAAVAIGHDLSAEDTFAVLQPWNARCSPPWAAGELKQKIRNAIRYGKGERGEKLVDFALTEVGDAEFFVERFGDLVRFDHRRGRFVIFTEHQWRPDEVERLHLMAIETMRERKMQAVQLGGDKRTQERRVKWAISGESRKRLDNMLVHVRAMPPIAESGANWNPDPFLLGVPNGVVDLRTAALRPGRAEDLITMRASVPFDPAASCPLWIETIRAIFSENEELIAYMQRAIGYSLTGDCREECLFFTYGAGRNGKGTVMNTIAKVLGEYADNLPFSALEMHERSGGIPNDIAKLVGKRFVTASESGETRLNTARVKSITGRDPIDARFMRQEWFTFQPVSKFWLATNRKPQVDDVSEGFWSRIHLIPFERQFTGAANDKTLKDRLLAEAPGILAWAVRGAIAWQAEGGLNPPAAVRAATQAYRDESNPLAEFLEACCVIQDSATVQAGVLFAEYERWCNRRDLPEWKRMKLRSFGEWIRERFKAEDRRRVTFYRGVGLKAQDSEPSLL